MPPKPTSTDKFWVRVAEWMHFHNRVTTPAGNRKRASRVRHVPPSAGHDIGVSPGTWLDPLGFWSFADATSKLCVPMIVDEGERIRSAFARVIVPTGGTDQASMTLYRMNCTDMIEDALGQALSDTMVDLQTINVTGLAELSTSADTHYIAIFENLQYQSGGTICSFGYVTDIATDPP